MRERATHPVAPVRQFFTLCLRMLSVIIADRGYALFLLGLPLALGLLSHTVPGDKGLGADPAGYSLEAQRLLVVLVIGAAFMGVAVAIREIVNEQSIYRRERAIGLSPTAYLASKVAVFVIIDTIQVILFVYIALLGRRGRPTRSSSSRPWWTSSSRSRSSPSPPPRSACWPARWCGRPSRPRRSSWSA